MEAKLQQWMEQAATYLQEGQVQEGLQLLEKTGVKAGKFPAILMTLATTYYYLGHMEKAEEYIMKISDDSEEELVIEKNLLQAEILLDQEKWDETLEILIDLKEQGPDNIRVFILLADCYAAQGLLEVACRYLEQALQIDPEQPDIRTALGEMYEQLGESQRALEQWDQIEDASRQEQIFFHKGRTLAQSGQFEEALFFFRKSLAEQETAEARFSYGYTAYQLGEWEEAIRAFTKLLEYDSDYVAVYPVLGECYMMAEKLDKAINYYRKAFDLDESNEQVVLRLAELLFENQELQESTALLKKAIHLDKENPLPYYYLGKIHLQEGDAVQAFKYFEESAEQGGQFPELVETLSDYYMETEQYQKVIPLLKSTLEHQSENWVLINRLAQLLMEEGELEEACQWYEKSLQINPDQFEIAEWVDRYRGDFY